MISFEMQDRVKSGLRGSARGGFTLPLSDGAPGAFDDSTDIVWGTSHD